MYEPELTFCSYYGGLLFFLPPIPGGYSYCFFSPTYPLSSKLCGQPGPGLLLFLPLHSSLTSPTSVKKKKKKYPHLLIYCAWGGGYGGTQYMGTEAWAWYNNIILFRPWGLSVCLYICACVWCSCVTFFLPLLYLFLYFDYVLFVYLVLYLKLLIIDFSFPLSREFRIHRSYLVFMFTECVLS